MPDQRSRLYLARASYRQRRLIDAQRLLPVLLFGLFLLPLLWGGDGTERPVGAGATSTIFVFATWGGAIVAAYWFSSAMRRGDDTPALQDGDRGPEDRDPDSVITSQDPSEG